MSAYKIIISDDHQVVIEGIRTMLESEAAFEVVGTASSIEGIFSVVAQTHADLALLDLNMNGSSMLDHIEELKARFTKLKTIIISSYNEPTLVHLAREKGIDGYIVKNTPKKTLIHILNIVLEGGKYFDKCSKKKYIPSAYNSTLPDADNFLKKELLSEREIEIIRLIAQGKTEQEMAEILFLSKHTVHTHRKNIMKKLGSHSAVDVVRFGYENGLIR